MEDRRLAHCCVVVMCVTSLIGTQLLTDLRLHGYNDAEEIAAAVCLILFVGSAIVGYYRCD